MTIALLAGDVVDPVDGHLGASTVLLLGGRIAEVAPGHRVPAGAETVDLRGLTLLPGLIDAHVHLNLRADGRMYETAEESDAALTATTRENARTALAAGITTVRDVGSKDGTAFAARAEGSPALLPRMLISGPPVTATGGHCWFLGGPADGVEEVQERVRALAAAGADWIKVMATGGGTPGTVSWEPSYSQAELDAIVDQAHSLGIKVTMHCLSGVGMARAVDAGADHIEHAGFAIDGDGAARFEPELADRMAEAGVVVTPTLSVRLFMRNHAIATGAASEVVDAWEKRFDNGMQQFGGLYRAGVRFAAGTDAGWHRTPFDGLATEMECLAACGPGSAETLRAATSTTAAHFGLADAGRVRAGADADLIAVDGDPLADLSALSRVRHVVRGGASLV